MHLRKPFFESLDLMISYKHHSEELRSIGLEILYILYSSSLDSADIITQMGTYEVIDSLYRTKNSVIDETSIKLDEIIRRHLFLSGKGDIGNVHGIQYQHNPDHIISCRRRLEELLRNLSMNFIPEHVFHQVSNVNIERVVTYAINNGLCDDVDVFKNHYLSLMSNNKQDLKWLILSLYLITGNSSTVPCIAKLLSIPSDEIICEHVEMAIYERYPAVWGWFMTNEEGNRMAHYIARWTKDWFMGDLPFNHVAEIITITAEKGWEQGLVEIYVMMLCRVAKQEGTWNLLSLQDLTDLQNVG